MIKQKDVQDNITLVYSKNNCTYCKATKAQLDDSGIKYFEVNIEETDDIEAYIEYLKEDNPGLTTMPVVYPAKITGLIPFSGFQPTRITEIALVLSENK